MSLYAKERPDNLRQSLDSVFSQTVPADEVVLVEDGPLTTELYDVLSEYQHSHPELKRIPLAKNGGLGKALNEGLKHCSYDIVARMDTDDVAKPNRFEKQLAYMESHPEISVCGTWIDEFVGSIDNVVSCRSTVETPEEIREFARTRNPMNHPSVMFRKADVYDVGGYMHFPLFEDWFLWARMLCGGYRLANLPESLLWFRTSPDMFKRRGGWRYAKDSMRFQFTLHGLGFIGLGGALKGSLLRGAVYVMPNFIRGWVYSRFLRK